MTKNTSVETAQKGQATNKNIQPEKVVTALKNIDDIACGSGSALGECTAAETPCRAATAAAQDTAAAFHKGTNLVPYGTDNVGRRGVET